MVSSLEKINATLAHEIDNAMLLCESPRPTAWREIFERFGLANSFERLTQDGFNQFKGAQGQFTVSFDPVAQILDKFGLEDRLTLFCLQGPLRGVDRQ